MQNVNSVINNIILSSRVNEKNTVGSVFFFSLLADKYACKFDFLLFYQAKSRGVYIFSYLFGIVGVELYFSVAVVEMLVFAFVDGQHEDPLFVKEAAYLFYAFFLVLNMHKGERGIDNIKAFFKGML